jgi:hypothetical protein
MMARDICTKTMRWPKRAQRVRVSDLLMMMMMMMMMNFVTIVMKLLKMINRQQA